QITVSAGDEGRLLAEATPPFLGGATDSRSAPAAVAGSGHARRAVLATGISRRWPESPRRLPASSRTAAPRGAGTARPLGAYRRGAGSRMDARCAPGRGAGGRPETSAQEARRSRRPTRCDPERGPEGQEQGDGGPRPTAWDLDSVDCPFPAARPEDRVCLLPR